MTDPLTGLETDLETQRKYVAEQVPAYARLLELLPALLDEARRQRLRAAWADRKFGAFYERPLLLLAALREDALVEGPSHPIFAAVGADQPDPGELTTASLAAALERDRVWDSLAHRHVQTNETSRAVAWLWPAALIARSAPGRSIVLFDVGASAGLNLVADRLAPIWVDGEGRSLPVSPIAPITSRRGFDLRPLDVLDSDSERWLRACVWPGQRDRLARIDEAIEAFRALAATGEAPVVERRAAADVPAVLPQGGGDFALAYQTVVRDYLPADERTRYEAGMRQWLADLPPGAAAWIQLELEAGVDVAKPFGLTAHLATEAEPIMLARCDPHPRTMLVENAGVDRFLGALGR